MNNKDLIATYFRQQAELGMPDIFTSNTLLQTVTVSSDQHNHPPGGITGTTSHTKSSATIKPLFKNATAHSEGSTASIKNRLSSLRPVAQLMATAEKRSSSTPLQSNPAIDSSTPTTDKRNALATLYRAGCTACHLAESRNSFVFGGGSADAPVMIIGEAPGKDEDEQGRPFVGAAGKLLTSMLAAIDLDRSKDVFITNILKCRPPQNRSPESSEIITCLPLLQKQITIIKPRAILLLGRIAAHALLDINESIAKMRARIFNYNDISTMVTYHPAALLRNAEYKRPAWEDLKQFQTTLASMGIYGSLRKE